MAQNLCIQLIDRPTSQKQCFTILRELANTLFELKKANNITIVIVSHNIDYLHEQLTQINKNFVNILKI